MLQFARKHPRALGASTATPGALWATQVDPALHMPAPLVFGAVCWSAACVLTMAVIALAGRMLSSARRALTISAMISTLANDDYPAVAEPWITRPRVRRLGATTGATCALAMATIDGLLAAGAIHLGSPNLTILTLLTLLFASGGVALWQIGRDAAAASLADHQAHLAASLPWSTDDLDDLDRWDGGSWPKLQRR